MTIALATSAALPGLASDDRLLLRALRARGLAAEPVVWEDRLFDWTAVTLCVIRSAWDYAYRLPEFLGWVHRLAEAVPLWNPAPVIVWNTHKQYLVDLAARGVPTVPTRVLAAGSHRLLADVLEETGWEDVVLKAAVAQTGRYLMRVDVASRDAGQRHLDRLLRSEDMLVQPFQPGVTREGETSLVFLDGMFSHAVRKRPAHGDFRVHDDFDGTVEQVAPDEAQLAIACEAVRALDHPLLYARVDLVPGTDGPVVMELELVEPDLFLRTADGAAERMAEAVAARAV
jgi:glutathione synthase/RimK-type ligase-like ATP-grasp enzyme